MTAQLVVMNTGGIALASDSAVTIHGKKVYHSANKLIHLAENHTIGVMIYGSSSLFHVPWETLIKVYRNTLTEPLDSVKNYLEGFIHFLHHNPYKEFLDEINEERYIENTLYRRVQDLYRDLSAINNNLYSEYGELHLQDEIQEIYAEQAAIFLDEQARHLSDKAYPLGFNEHDEEILMEKYEDKICSLLTKQFDNHLLQVEWTPVLTQLMIQSILKDFSNNYSGIVFAGYGDKEIYPSAYVMIIDGKVNNKTKYFTRKKIINYTTHGSILPFAQRDMMRSFLDGIHEEMEDFLSTFLQRELHHVKETFLHQIKDYLREDMSMDVIDKEISHTISQFYQHYQNEVATHKRKHFIDPILDIVDSLPASELAHLSESLLNVTSLKRKMSIEMETVGGPIDVAIITKGDGFKWVKKK
ncbi:hypothetical protein ACFOZ1_02215 [Gracilibacillus marinus]|uniref:Uncharacterized protein n=1 Tax=Gracilibacillus marinus TaxID=630535 RepID=A0ABV8VSF6_9BACI